MITSALTLPPFLWDRCGFQSAGSPLYWFSAEVVSFLNSSCLRSTLHYLSLIPLFCSNTVCLPEPWCFASSCQGLLPSFPFLFFICSVTVELGIQYYALYHLYHIRGLYSCSSNVHLCGGGSPTPILGFGVVDHYCPQESVRSFSLLLFWLLVGTIFHPK